MHCITLTKSVNSHALCVMAAQNAFFDASRWKAMAKSAIVALFWRVLGAPPGKA
jgi:hypothetical protein